jgi:hypothetical protein
MSAARARLQRMDDQSLRGPGAPARAEGGLREPGRDAPGGSASEPKFFRIFETFERGLFALSRFHWLRAAPRSLSNRRRRTARTGRQQKTRSGDLSRPGAISRLQFRQ